MKVCRIYFKMAFVLLFLASYILSCSKKEDNTTDKPDEKPKHILLEQLPEHIVMYEVNIRAFSTEGDLAGVTGRLDQIDALGANVIG